MSKTDELIPQIKLVNVVNDQLFCLCGDCSCILCINLNNFEAKYVGELEGENFFQFALSCCSLVYKNNILYSPYYSKNIHFFDCDKKKDSIIANFPEMDTVSSKYVALLQNESRCYIIPYVGENIWEIDMDKMQILRKIDIYNILKKKGIAVDNNNFSESEGYRYNNKFYFAIENIPYIIELDIKNDSYEAYKLDGLSEGLCGIAGIDNILYIYSKENYIITYNIDDKKVLDKVRVLNSNDIFFYRSLIIGNDIYFVQGGQSTAVKYNIATYKAEYINFNDELRSAPDGEDYKFIGSIEKNRIILISEPMSMVIVDLENRKCEYKQIKYNIDDLKNSIMQNAHFQSENKESSKRALRYYIQYEKFNRVNKIESCVGAEIYRTI